MVLVFFWLVAVAGWIVWIGQRDQAASSDVIIVLGAAAYDAKPSPVFEKGSVMVCICISTVMRLR